MKIAVLALQGAFLEHEQILSQLGIDSFEIRQKKDLKQSFDGLILPGGESTTMGKLLWDLELYHPLQRMIKNGLPVFGTCAGLILLAERVEDGVPHLSTMGITAKRNAYGRQLGSFTTSVRWCGEKEFPAVFIRAPYIVSVTDKVKVLAEADGKIVAAQQKNQLVTAFHPELTDDLTVHQYFIDLVKRHKA